MNFVKKNRRNTVEIKFKGNTILLKMYKKSHYIRVQDFEEIKSKKTDDVKQFDRIGFSTFKFIVEYNSNSEKID